MYSLPLWVVNLCSFPVFLYRYHVPPIMNPDQINNKIDEIRELIAANHLADAIASILTLAKDESDFDALAKAEKINENYKYLLHYFTLGADDPTREAQYASLAEALTNLCDDLQLNLNTSVSPALTYSTRRIYRHRGEGIAEALTRLDTIDAKIENCAPDELRPLTADRTLALTSLFDIIWSANHDKSGYAELRRRFQENTLDIPVATYIISALTIGLLQFYNSEKLELLIEIYNETDEDLIAAPALTGVVLALAQNNARVLRDRKILKMLENWEDSILTYSRLRDVVKSIIRTRDTDRTTEKMQSELIPELKKLNPEVLRKMKQQGMESDAPMLENNPEWEEMLEKSGIADKMRELTELQKEGADLLMLTFSSLKGFPFFGNVAAWFLPFEPHHPAINLDADMLQSIVALFDMAGEMCDSDKYSLALAFSSMPEQQRSMMFGQFKTQLAQMEEQLNSIKANQPRREFNAGVTLFIRNLYRLMKLFRKRDELNDPFAHPLDFTALPVVGKMLSDHDMLKVVAEFYFKRGYYREALSLFQSLEEELKNDAGYWEKVGFCQQSLQLIPYAFTSYQRAELLKQPSLWLLRRLAYCAKRLGDLKNAVAYYEQALAIDPDNRQLLLAAANTLAEAGDYPEALKHYYHVNYIDPDNHKIWSGIAWLEFLLRNSDKSMKYYSKILADNPSASDWLNAAHVLLADGHIVEALEHYRKSVNTDREAFKKGFEDDRATMLKLGVPPLTLDLIRDAVLTL